MGLTRVLNFNPIFVIFDDFLNLNNWINENSVCFPLRFFCVSLCDYLLLANTSTPKYLKLRTLSNGRSFFFFYCSFIEVLRMLLGTLLLVTNNIIILLQYLFFFFLLIYCVVCINWFSVCRTIIIIIPCSHRFIFFTYKQNNYYREIRFLSRIEHASSSESFRSVVRN